MPSAVIHSAHGYPAFTLGRITGTPEVRPPQSSRTKGGYLQCSNAYTGYGPNCFTTFWTQLTYHFNGRTAQPLGRTTAPGYDKPTSRCQTFPSMWTLGEDQPVHFVITCAFSSLHMFLFISTVKTLVNCFIKFTGVKTQEFRLCHQLAHIY